MSSATEARGAQENGQCSGAAEGRLAAVAIGAVALHVVLGLVLYDPGLFPGGDNAGYMILGESLREGHGYRDLYLPATPVHTKYPPGYPLLLAVLGGVGGLQLFKAASLALTAGTVWLTWRLGRELAGPWVGLIAAVLLALSPVLLEYSHWVLSEAQFTFLVLATLVAYERSRAPEAEAAGPQDPQGRSGGAGHDARGDTRADAPSQGPDAGSDAPHRRGYFALALVLAAAAFLTRTAGIPLLAALAVHTALARESRRVVAAVATAAVVLGGWAWFQTLGPPGQPGYLEELVLLDPYDPAAGSVGVGGLVGRAATNLWLYVSEALPSALGMDPGAGPIAGPHPAAVLAGAAVAAVALAGWFREAVRGLTAAGLFTLLYVGLIVLWPTVWTDRRFLLPVLPLVLLYAVDGARLAGAWALGRNGIPVAAAAAALAAVPAVIAAVDLAPDRIRCRLAEPAEGACLDPAFASFLAAARWADAETPADAVFSSRKPRIFYWVSGRRGDVYRYSAEPELVIGSLEDMGADFVVVDRLSATTVRYLIPAIRSSRDRFQVVHATAEPATLVLHFLPEPRTAAAAPASGDPPRPSAAMSRPGPAPRNPAP